MSDAVVAAVAFMLFVPILALIAGAAWAFRRRKPVVASASVVLLCGYIGLGISERLVPGFDWLYDRWFTRDLTGVGASLGTPLHTYETERSWHGDGHTVLTFHLPSRLAERFRGAPADLTTYPRRPRDRDGWDVSHWKPTPARAEDHRYIEFAISGAPHSVQAEVRTVLNIPGGWYAFLSREGGSVHAHSWVMNVDFYVVDPLGRRFYLVNHNT
jgi:hypothetical protein